MRAYGTGQAAMQRGTICESPLDLPRAEGFHLAPALSRPVPGLVAAGKTRLRDFWTREKPVYSQSAPGPSWAQWAVAHKAIVRCQKLVLRARRATLVGSSQTTTAVGVTPHP